MTQKILASFCLFLISNLCIAESITIAAASDLRFALDEVISLFEQKHPRSNITVIYGSSGKFRTQIQHGAPYDLYFSADISYPHSLYELGYAGSKVLAYAAGRLVIWSHSKNLLDTEFESIILTDSHRIAIANPKHAPYGMKAEQILMHMLERTTSKPKLIYGESVLHAAQLAISKQVDFGIIALSIGLSPTMQKEGRFVLIPEHLHSPLLQGFIITNHGVNKPLSKVFADFMSDKQVLQILVKYGFQSASSVNLEEES